MQIYDEQRGFIAVQLDGFVALERSARRGGCLRVPSADELVGLVGVPVHRVQGAGGRVHLQRLHLHRCHLQLVVQLVGGVHALALELVHESGEMVPH